MMQQIDDEEQMMVEMHAEREAIRRVRGASFAHSLTLNSLAEDLEVIGKNGRPEKVHGKDIVSQKTWASFLAKQTSIIELGGIAFTAGPLAVRYATWLRTEYTSRYRWFVREEEKAWLKQVALLAVLWHVLEHKQETNTFLDAWAASEMEKLTAAREASREMAKAVHHGVKDQAFTVLAQTYETYLHWIDARQFIPAPPLPPLPPGTPDLLALPEDKEEKHDG